MSNSNFINGQTPLSYAGVAARTPPNIFKYSRSPNTSDSVGYALGDLWLRSPANTPELWVLISLIEYTAIWVKLYPSTATGIEFVTDAGTANPLAGILNVLGDGIGINTSATGNTITIHADSDVAEIYRTDSGDAAPSSGVLRIIGGNNINTSAPGSTNVVEVSLNDNVTIEGSLGVVLDTTLGTTLTVLSLGEGVVQSDALGLVSSSAGTDGQVLVGATAGSPAWANITSTGGTVTITNGANTINLEAAGGSGGNTIISQFTSSGTWNKNVATQYIEVYGWCGGGGGASGSLATFGSSAGGGGGGSYGVFYFYGPAFSFDNSVSITIGAGGIGGAGVGAGSPNPGGDGSPTYFGDISTRAAQNASPINGSGGGGWLSLQPGNTTPGYWGDYTTTGLCVDALNGRVGKTTSTYPGTGTNSSNGIAGTDRKFVSSALSQPGVAFNIDYGSFIMSGTGGGGAGVTIATPVANTGGKGGSIFNPVTGAANLVEGGAGGNENTSVDGSNGSDGVTGSAVNLLCGGSGGGGGGNQAVGVAAGDGGNGGFPGGGGGGGGGCVTGSTGSGGNGADGFLIVIEYL